MTMKDKHHKHPPIARPARGMYHRCEWGIYGTDCGKVEAIVAKLVSALTPYRVTYVDADHGDSTHGVSHQVGKKQYHLTASTTWSIYDDKLQLWQSDAVLVNGNHYPAQRQIIVLNEAKKESLRRRIEQLTDVDIVITTASCTVPFDFLTENLLAAATVFHESDMDKIAQYLRATIVACTPPLKALILAGGKSQRMGTDKAALQYHDGISQQKYIADMCSDLGLDTYISKGHDYGQAAEEGVPVIADRFVELGPSGAIMSAFMHDPNAAWLVLACDLPLIDAESIKYLIAQRDSTQLATAYKLQEQKFAEPLIAIYEPSAYQRMLRFLSLGYACPRKVLINSDVKILQLADERAAFNANTESERQQAIQILSQQ